MNNEVIINTTKLKNVRVKKEFYKKYFIYRTPLLSEQNIKRILSEIKDDKKVISSFKDNMYYYLMSKNVLGKKTFSVERLSEIKNDENYICLNLILRSLPFLKRNEFVKLENLSYFYNKKDVEKYGISEFIFYEATINKENVLKINSVTYSDKKKLMEKPISPSFKYKIEKRSVFNYQNNVDLIRIKHPISPKNMGISHMTEYEGFDRSKMYFIMMLKENLESMSDILEFDFSELEGFFKLRNDNSTIISKLKSELSYDEELDNFYRNKIIGVIDLFDNNPKKKEERFEKIKESIKNVLPVTKLNIKSVNSQKRVCHFYIVITQDKSYYVNSGEKDPVLIHRNKNSHILNYNKKKTLIGNFSIPKIKTILKEIVLKNNLKSKKLVSFKRNDDSLYFNITVGDHNNETLIKGCEVRNNVLSFYEDDNVIFEEIKNIISNNAIKVKNKKNFEFLSYGDKDDNLYENKFLIVKRDENPIPYISNIKNKFDNADPDIKNFLTRENINYGKNSDLHGFYGIFYTMTEKSIIYYIGSLVQSPQSKISSFTGLYEAFIIDGKIKVDDFFSFYEESYITFEDTTKHPFLLKYIRLNDEYS